MLSHTFTSVLLKNANYLTCSLALLETEKSLVLINVKQSQCLLRQIDGLVPFLVSVPVEGTLPNVLKPLIFTKRVAVLKGKGVGLCLAFPKDIYKGRNNLV